MEATMTIDAKIAPKREFLQKVMPFIDQILKEHGVEQECRGESPFEHSATVLENFGGFSLERNSHSLCGLHRFDVWSLSRDRVRHVLSLYYCHPGCDWDYCTVDLFDPGDWQVRLLNLSDTLAGVRGQKGP